MRPSTKPAPSIIVAGALAAILAACGSAPRYQLDVYFGDDECLEDPRQGDHCDPAANCTVSVAFDFDCPLLSSDIVTDSVAIDYEAREVQVAGHGCADVIFDDPAPCYDFTAWARFDDTGSFKGRTQIEPLGYDLVIVGTLS